MNVSIRKLLLSHLLFVITLMLFISTIGAYILDKKNINDYLDNLLILVAEEYRAVITTDHQPQEFAKIQSQLDKAPHNISRYTKQNLRHSPQMLINQFPFQIWSTDDTLLLHSANAPKESLLGKQEGLTDKHADGDHWRVFTLYLADGTKLAVAQSHTIRNSLLYQVTENDFYVLLATLLIAGLLIWIIIGNQFKSLSKLAKQIANRAPTHLDPVDTDKIPTEIKPVVDEINNLLMRLQQGLEREKRFAADAAHELRTPLAALKTQAQVALKTQDPKERNLALRNLIHGVNRSSRIVQQLLTLSRLVPEASPITDHENVKIAKLASEIIAQIAPSAIEKNIDISLDCSDDQIIVHGNPTALSILIRNLIDNAVRYTGHGGQVTVNITTTNKHIIFQVADTGPGIPIELRSRVFERFFRVLGNQSPGSGLGLAIVQQIATLHHATVNLTNPQHQSGLIVEVLFPKIK